MVPEKGRRLVVNLPLRPAHEFAQRVDDPLFHVEQRLLLAGEFAQVPGVGLAVDFLELVEHRSQPVEERIAGCLGGQRGELLHELLEGRARFLAQRLGLAGPG